MDNFPFDEASVYPVALILERWNDCGYEVNENEIVFKLTVLVLNKDVD